MKRDQKSRDTYRMQVPPAGDGLLGQSAKTGSVVEELVVES
jgi:hypothetical protein